MLRLGAATHEDLVTAQYLAYIQLLEKHQHLKGQYKEFQ
jgi:hypothetical protein